MSRILLSHFLRAALFFVSAAGLVALLVFGLRDALGVLVGGALLVISGGGLISVVSRMLEPGAKAKGVLGLLMLFKLVLVAALLWAALTRWNVSGLGLILGMGAGLAALVVGLHRGSTSAEGQRRMAEDEARIREDLGDNGDESS